MSRVFTGGGGNYLNAVISTASEQTEYTFAGWAKFTTRSGTTRAVLGMNADSGLNPSIALFDNDVFAFRRANAHEGSGATNGVAALTLNSWRHYALVLSGGTVQLFLDGASVASTAGVVGGLPTNVSELAVGAMRGGDIDPFLGKIGRVSGWARALSAGEITDLAAGGLPSDAGSTARWFDYDPDTLTNQFTPAAGLTAGALSVTGTVAIDGADNPPISGAAAPTITDAGDEVFQSDETGIVITGTGFGASQGSGGVFISPTNNVADAGRVAQTVTAWSDTSITITCNRGALAFLTGLHLFVTNGAGQSNATGYSVQIEPRVTIGELFVNKASVPQASLSGLRVLVWRSEPTGQAPDQVLNAQSLNGSGVSNWPVSRGTLTPGDPLWFAVVRDGSPAIGTIRKFVPTYS